MIILSQRQYQNIFIASSILGVLNTYPELKTLTKTIKHFTYFNAAVILTPWYKQAIYSNKEARRLMTDD